MASTSRAAWAECVLCLDGRLELGLWVVVVRAALGGLYTIGMTSVSARE